MKIFTICEKCNDVDAYFGENSCANYTHQCRNNVQSVGDKISVGHYRKKLVSELNRKLFLEAKDVLENNHDLSHIGWVGVSEFIDHLEQNYNITEK